MLREDLVYKDEYYKIVGILIKVFKDLGGELLEKHYQADFLIRMGEAKIILEIKKHENFGIKNIKQLSDYIKLEHIKLGILANFTKTGVVCKRIVNLATQV
jgi:hypothetical protein